LPFNGIDVEHAFIEQRIDYEMNDSRTDDEKFFATKWKLKEQRIFKEAERYYDRFIFEITAFHKKDWDELNIGGIRLQKKRQAINKEDLEKICQEKLMHFTREFWFDITSFWNNNR
jgi:hypothetical protein